MSTTIRTVAAVLLAAGAAAASPGASAVDVEREIYQNGGSACTGALPTFEGALRKRPRAIANEGTSTAFISCSMDTDDFAEKPHYAFVRVGNTSAITQTVTCTLVNGADWEGGTSEVKSVDLASGDSDLITWGAGNPSETLDYYTVNFSCALPPGTLLSYAGRMYMEPVGE